MAKGVGAREAFLELLDAPQGPPVAEGPPAPASVSGFQWRHGGPHPSSSDSMAVSPGCVVFLPLKSPASLTLGLPTSLSPSPASVCIPSPFCGHHEPLCSSTPPLCSLKQTGPGSPPSPSRKARVLLTSIPSSAPPATSHLLSWALPLLRLGSLAGFSGKHLDGRAGEAYRNRAAASGSRGAAPNRPCLFPLAS